MPSKQSFFTALFITVFSHNLANAGAGDNASAFAERALVVVTKDQPQRKCFIADDNTMIICGAVRLGLVNVRREILTNDIADDSVDNFIAIYYGLAFAAAYDGEKAPNEVSSEEDIARGIAPTLTAIDRLYPQIVPSSYLEQMGSKNVTEFLPGLLTAYSIDNAGLYMLVLDKQVAELGLSRDQIKDYAYKNLAAKAMQTDIGLSESSVGNETKTNWLAIDVKDGYAAARILLPNVRDRIATQLGGEHFYLAMPNRDFLVAWSMDFLNHLKFIDMVKEDFETRSHPLSPNLFIGSKEGIRPVTAEELYPKHAVDNGVEFIMDFDSE